jgi:hypothetical protein
MGRYVMVSDAPSSSKLANVALSILAFELPVDQKHGGFCVHPGLTPTSKVLLEAGVQLGVVGAIAAVVLVKVAGARLLQGAARRRQAPAYMELGSHDGSEGGGQPEERRGLRQPLLSDVEVEGEGVYPRTPTVAWLVVARGPSLLLPFFFSF